MNNENLLNKFKELVTGLIRLGADDEELRFWREIFASLSPAEQQRLFGQFQQELSALESA